MEYKGKYRIFDARKIRTYPLAGRRNKVKFGSLVWPDVAMASRDEISGALLAQIKRVAESVVAARRKNRAVICFTGAHLIKNGMGPLLADLVERDFVTLVGGNAATSIHDFELALIGETSEDVPNALPQGKFGMAREFAFINAALKVGNAERLGFGESLGRMIVDDTFRRKVVRTQFQRRGGERNVVFGHPEASVLARAYKHGVPVTIMAGIGTDVIDQHPNFDGEAKGGASGRDFLIFAGEVTRLGKGVMLNIGSAVTGPEVLLKAVSMAGNIGHPPKGLVTADFDIRPGMREHMGAEDKYGYYFRDQKSVVTRIPEAFGGKGLYVHGNQTKTFPAFYRALRRLV